MYDFVFLHPPVSFKKIQYPLGGLFEAGTGTTDLLTMMPNGVLSLANELHAAGYKTAVVNVARKLHQIRGGAKESIQEFLAQFPAKAYGIDLHWAAHGSGAIDLARLCKELQPKSVVIFGGLSSTYFREEILSSYPFVDGIIQGECDGLMPEIVRSLIADPRRFDQTPNLAYREDGKTRCNACLPPDLGKVDYIDTHNLTYPRVDLGVLDREAFVLNLPVVRGCSQDCLHCGGSRNAYRCFYHRDDAGYLSIDKVMEQIRSALSKGMNAVKLFGDVRICGDDYVSTLLREIGQLSAPLDLAIELFWPASREYLEKWRKVARDLFVSFSPESVHEGLRRGHGKSFKDTTLFELSRICRELDINLWHWLVYLQPGHTPQNLMQELDVMEEIAAIGPNITVIIQPYLFLDPACAIFEHPEEFGFSVRLRTLAQIREALEKPYWYYTIGYRTNTFSEADFHAAILEVTRRMAEIYFKEMRLSARDFLKTRKNLECHKAMGNFIARNPNAGDAEIQSAVQSIFPEYLRRSNSNLLIWPFLGAPLEKVSTPEAMVYDAFPTTLELALRWDLKCRNDIYESLERWMESNSKAALDCFNSPKLPTALLDLVRHLLAHLHLPGDFVDDLAAFEWDIFRLLLFQSPMLDGQALESVTVIKPYGYDLICIQEILETILRKRIPPAPQITFYSLDPRKRSVLSMNFDPRRLTEPLAQARIRLMSPLGRRLIHADPIMIKVFSRLYNRSNVHKPVTLWNGPLTPEQFQKLTSTPVN